MPNLAAFFRKYFRPRESRFRLFDLNRYGMNALRLHEETDLYHFRCDGPRWRDRRWFMTKGGCRRSGADTGSGRVTLPAAFAGVFLLRGRAAAAAAVLRTL